MCFFRFFIWILETQEIPIRWTCNCKATNADTNNFCHSCHAARQWTRQDLIGDPTNLQTQEVAETGARREKLYPKGEQFPIRLDLLFQNVTALRELAEVYGEGAAKYPPGNWMKGFEESVLIDHALEHIRLHFAKDSTENHLAHALWNLFTLIWVRKHKPELMNLTNENFTGENSKIDSD